MAKIITGRPSDIDAWREQQYLDLERRRLHIPSGIITWDMLTDNVKRLLSNLPIGYYSGNGSTFELAIDEVGRVAFIPTIWGNSQYGLCVFGAAYGVYGMAKYGESSYAEYTLLVGKYNGTGGYGYVKYG